MENSYLGWAQGKKSLRTSCCCRNLFRDEQPDGGVAVQQRAGPGPGWLHQLPQRQLHSRPRGQQHQLGGCGCHHRSGMLPSAYGSLIHGTGYLVLCSFLVTVSFSDFKENSVIVVL